MLIGCQEIWLLWHPLDMKRFYDVEWFLPIKNIASNDVCPQMPFLSWIGLSVKAYNRVDSQVSEKMILFSFFHSFWRQNFMRNVQISLCKKLTNKWYHVQAMPKRLQLNTSPKARWKDVTNTGHCNCYKRTKHILSEFGLKCWKWHWKSVNPRWCKITNIRDHNNILNYLFHKRQSALRNESKRRLSRLCVYLQDWWI